MRYLIPLLLLAVAVPVRAAVTYWDLTSGSQQLTGTLGLQHTFRVTVHPGATAPNVVALDILYPVEDTSEWGNAQEYTSPVQFTVNPGFGATENFSGQWQRFLFDTSSYDWTWPIDFTVDWVVGVRRNQHLSEVVDDYTVGGVYVTNGGLISAPSSYYQFADHVEANPVSNQVNGKYGSSQRIAAYVRNFSAPDCGNTTYNFLASMRHLNIPSCFVLGKYLTGQYTLPNGFGSYPVYGSATDSQIGHCCAGVWDASDVWKFTDVAGLMVHAQALQFVQIGYFEFPEDGSSQVLTDVPSSNYSVQPFYFWTDMSVQSENQTYNWRLTRNTTETQFNDIQLYCEKVPSSWKGGQPFVDPDPGVVGVGNDLPGVVKQLAIFPSVARAGERLWVEVGAPDHMVSATLNLYDVQGRKINGWELDQQLSGYNSFNLSLPDSLSSGVYFARLNFENKTVAVWRVTVIN